MTYLAVQWLVFTYLLANQNNHFFGLFYKVTWHTNWTLGFRTESVMLQREV